MFKILSILIDDGLGRVVTVNLNREVKPGTTYLHSVHELLSIKTVDILINLSLFQRQDHLEKSI